jgi:hypothetical protein
MHPNDIPIVAMKWLEFLAPYSEVSGSNIGLRPVS